MYSFESNLVSNETILSELMGTVQYALTENSLFSAQTVDKALLLQGFAIVGTAFLI